MRYDLDFTNSFDRTLLFWIERFIRYKLTTLSNRQVTDKERLAFIIQSLVKGLSLHKGTKSDKRFKSSLIL